MTWDMHIVIMIWLAIFSAKLSARVAKGESRFTKLLTETDYKFLQYRCWGNYFLNLSYFYSLMIWGYLIGRARNSSSSSIDELALWEGWKIYLLFRCANWVDIEISTGVKSKSKEVAPKKLLSTNVLWDSELSVVSFWIWKWKSCSEF